MIERAYGNAKLNYSIVNDQGYVFENYSFCGAYGDRTRNTDVQNQCVPISTKAPFVIVFVTQQPLRGQSGRDRTGGLKNPNLAVYL